MIGGLQCFPTPGPFSQAQFAIWFAFLKERPMIEPGDKIPDFDLLNQNGEAVTAADWQGRKVVLFAFPRADTPG